MATQSEQLSNLRSKFISDGVGSTTTSYIESARGAILRDVEGREYIDFAGGIGVMNIGHCHYIIFAARSLSVANAAVIRNKVASNGTRSLQGSPYLYLRF